MKWDGEESTVPNVDLIRKGAAKKEAEDLVASGFGEAFKKYKLRLGMGPNISIAKDGEKWPEKTLQGSAMRIPYATRLRYLVEALYRFCPSIWQADSVIRYEYRGNGKAQLWWGLKRKKVKHDNARKTEAEA